MDGRYHAVGDAVSLAAERRTVPTQIARGGSRPGALLPTGAAVALIAACAPISVLFSDGGWVGVAVATIAAVVATGGLLRATPVPLVVVPFAQTAAFAALMVWLFVDVDATGGSPTAITGAFRDLVLDGVDAVRTTTAPVPSTPQLLALLAVLLFLCALLLETLAVGLGLAGFSGLVLLMMAAVPQGIRPSGSMLGLLALAGAGWLVLLAADHTVRMRLLRTSAPPSTPTAWAGRSLGAAGLAVTALAASGLALTLVAPAATGSPWLRDWWNSTTGLGTAASSTLDPFVSVRSQLGARSSTEQLTYRSSDGQPSYLSMVTLESFDGTTWTPYPPAPGASVEQSAPGTRPGAEPSRTLAVQVEELDNSYLPVPEGTLSLSVEPGGSWSWDVRTGDAVSLGAPASGLRYQAVATSSAATPDQLSTASTVSPQASTTTRALPPGLPVEVGDLAAQVTAEAGSGYQAAVALQRWFTADGGFRYSLNVPDPGGRDALLAFLTDRVGFCQQYATAMAVMARTLGIPARVVVGFTGGTAVGDGTYLVTGADAHAWPELWFDGQGWVRFEPTPAAASAAVEPPAYSAPEPSAAALDPQDPPTAEAPQVEQTPGAVPSTDTAPAAGRVLGLAAGISLAAGLLVLPILARRLLRRRRLRRVRDGDVAAAWQEVAASALDAGVAWPAEGTMRQQASSVESALAHSHQVPQGAVWRLVSRNEIARYAPTDATPAAPSVVVLDEPVTALATAGLLEDVEECLSALDGLPRPGLRRIVPASLFRR
jgi:transglutaminase-like putative cysteine protease